jgi:hypothetical protein
MKRNIVILAALAFICLLAPAAHAQTSTYTISGTATWKGGGHNGEPVSGASVKIGPGNYSGTTDAQGHYSISGVKGGPHTLHLKATTPNGSVTKAVEVNQDKTVDITVRYRHVSVRKRKGGVGLQQQ